MLAKPIMGLGFVNVWLTGIGVIGGVPIRVIAFKTLTAAKPRPANSPVGVPTNPVVVPGVRVGLVVPHEPAVAFPPTAIILAAWAAPAKLRAATLAAIATVPVASCLEMLVIILSRLLREHLTYAISNYT
ncbi:unknown protein [Microcystis aeruginosa NIES-843]|uniref:Uncharacterized protein n=1 Tax=Microcystis aeruginosa (strain NIES-843 / IAM M-2473) TaxID=449447 RepID=B0JIN6_MICAN|nr:unknown protein [Microcystis aeruginosa NIES-843]